MPRTIATENDVASGAAKQSDSYSSRLVKYVPADVITAYLALNAIVHGATKVAVTEREIRVTTWIIFFVFLIATPFYLKLRVEISKARQVAIATISYAIWVFAVTPGGGPFTFKSRDFYASIVLPLYTFLIPLVDPEPGPNQTKVQPQPEQRNPAPNAPVINP